MSDLRHLGLFAICMMSAVAAAAEPDRGEVLNELLNAPLYSADRNPFVQIFGLPHPGAGRVLSKGETSYAVYLEAGNTFVDKGPVDDRIFIDGESYRFDLVLSRGWGQRWEAGVELPLIRHEGGRLDRLIEGWHDLTNLPNGNREKFDQDELLYRYTRGGITQYLLSEPTGGLGDIRLTAGFRINENLSWRSVLKLPTGDASSLTGSEAVDFSSGLTYTAYIRGDTVFHGGVGFTLMDKGKVLADQQKSSMLYGSAAVSWQALPRVSFKLQLNGHSAAYESEAKPLGETSIQLLAGASVVLYEQMALDFSFSEDLTVGTSPDVVFQVGARWSPR